MEAKKVITTSLVTSLIIGISFSLLGYFFIDDILALTGAEGELFLKSKDYLIYIILGSVFTILNMNLNNLVRAEGNAMFSMSAIALGAVVNVALDPILMFTMGMGVAGASLATAIAQGISTIFLLSFYLCKKSSLGFHLNLFSPSLEIYQKIAKIGLPSFARQSLTSIALALVNIAVIPFGDSGVAAIGIILRVTSLGLYVLFGIAQGFQPIAAYNFGAGKIDRVKEAIKYALVICSLFSLTLTLTFIVFSKNIIMIFSSHPEVVEMGSKSLVVIMLIFIANGFQILITTLFQALGKGRDSFILAVSRQGIFFIPAIAILPKVLGFPGIPFSFMAADALAFLLTFIMYYRLLKEFNEKNENIQFA